MNSKIRVAKISPDAIVPNKVHQSDSGYDITLISLAKKLGPNLYLYGTGLRIAPDEGYYVELVARSSLMKFGYILANGVGIIDNQYRGELFVALWKLDLSMPDIELPFRGAQIIPRQFIKSEIVLVSNDNLDETVRGDGGFGSTDLTLNEVLKPASVEFLHEMNVNNDRSKLPLHLKCNPVSLDEVLKASEVQTYEPFD